MSRNFRNLLCSSLVIAALMALSDSASAAEFGSIKGRFVFQGTAKAEPIIPTKDEAFCSQHQLVDETIVVGKDNGLQNVFVSLNPPRGKKVEIHESYDAAAAAKEPKVLDNKGCRFEPHAMTLWTAHPLQVHNSDPGIGHNTNASYFFLNKTFNETVPNDKPLLKNFTKSEAYPSKVACNVHPWMSAYILVRENPDMAVSAADGSFEIKNVPAGKHLFGFWHEAKGNLRDLMVGKAKADRKGQVNLEIPAGKTLDLGDIVITPAVLGK
jgi:hypothetical protein